MAMSMAMVMTMAMAKTMAMTVAMAIPPVRVVHICNSSAVTVWPKGTKGMDSQPTRRRSRSGGRVIEARQKDFEEAEAAVEGWKYFAEAQVESSNVQSVVTDRGQNGTIRFDNCAYVRVDNAAAVNDILRDLRVQGPAVLLMVCWCACCAEVWGPAPSQKKCLNFRGGGSMA